MSNVVSLVGQICAETSERVTAGSSIILRVELIERQSIVAGLVVVAVLALRANTATTRWHALFTAFTIAARALQPIRRLISGVDIPAVIALPIFPDDPLTRLTSCKTRRPRCCHVNGWLAVACSVGETLQPLLIVSLIRLLGHHVPFSTASRRSRAGAYRSLIIASMRSVLARRGFMLSERSSSFRYDANLFLATCSMNSR